MTRQTNFNEEEKIWSAAHTPIIFNPKNSLGHAILWSMDRSPTKIIQVKVIHFVVYLVHFKIIEHI